MHFSENICTKICNFINCKYCINFRILHVVWISVCVCVYARARVYSCFPVDQIVVFAILSGTLNTQISTLLFVSAWINNLKCTNVDLVGKLPSPVLFVNSFLFLKQFMGHGMSLTLLKKYTTVLQKCKNYSHEERWNINCIFLATGDSLRNKYNEILLLVGPVCCRSQTVQPIVHVRG